MKRHVTRFSIREVDVNSEYTFELTPLPPDGFDEFDTCVALPPHILEVKQKSTLMMFQWHWTKRAAYD